MRPSPALPFPLPACLSPPGARLAIKIRTHAYVCIYPGNDARNIPMLAMNERLGYVRKPDLITFEKERMDR